MDDEPLPIKEMLKSSDDFEAVYESHAKSIYKFLYWRTKNVQLSEDLTSSTFEKAWTSRANFHGGSVRAWLYRIARNVLIDHWRKKKEVLVEDSDTIQEATQADSSELLDEGIRLQDLKKALTTLSKDMRSVIELRFIEGLSCRQTARKLHISESNVRVIQYRALRKLKEYLQ